MYDWANSAFATTVVAGFFPIFFREFWSIGVDSSLTTFRLGLVSSIASLVIVVLAPILGAIADRAGLKKKLLMVFAFIGVISTFGLFLVGQGLWLPAIVLFAVASIGFFAANVFYDALLLDVAPSSDRIHMVSGFGYSLGYLGRRHIVRTQCLYVLNPEMFGLADSAQAVKISFLSVAIWWAAFSIPIMLYVKDTPPPDAGSTNPITSGFRQLGQTFREIRARKTILFVSVAYWFIFDGVDTVFRMSVDYGLAIGLNANDLIAALLLVQFIAFPAALGFGRLGHKIGPKNGIYIGILVYVVATVWAYFIPVP